MMNIMSTAITVSEGVIAVMTAQHFSSQHAAPVNTYCRVPSFRPKCTDITGFSILTSSALTGSHITAAIISLLL
ncbi:hypothetical protein BaRGS_00013061 [Batillaria attramentaria]|uniref:Uncharacterized protein n=1 Tax=Batillaria attramentaria TaxID=370345 RepID=A0ABD0L7N5_9CAEN